MLELMYGLSMFILMWSLNDYCPCDKELLFWSSINMIKTFLFVRTAVLPPSYFAQSIATLFDSQYVKCTRLVWQP